MNQTLQAMTKPLDTLPPRARRIVEGLHRASVETIVDEGGIVPAMVLVYADDPTRPPIAVSVGELMANDSSKDINAGVIDKLANTRGIAVVVFVCETWVADIAPGESIEIRPSDRSDRRECVLYSVRIGNWNAIVMADIKRNPNALGDPYVLNPDETTGRLAPRERP